LKFISTLLRKPNLEGFSSSIRHFFRTMFFFIKRPPSPLPPEDVKKVHPVQISFKKMAESGRVSVAEDIQLLKTFFRKVFRLPQPVEGPLPNFVPVNIFGRRLKDPTPKVHLLRLFFNEPRQALSILREKSWNLIVNGASHWKEATTFTLFFVLSLEISLHLTCTAGWGLVQLLHPYSPEEPRVALFIGDAFTSGEFATRKIQSYTDFVPNLLKKQGFQDWKAISYSSQHTDTSTILEVLPGLILRENPQYVYFMIGGDDLMQTWKPKEYRLPTRRVTESVPKDWLLAPHLIRKWQKNPTLWTILDFFTVPPFYVTNFQLERSSPKALEPQIQKLLKQPVAQWTLPSAATWYSEGGPALWNGKKLNVWNLKPLTCSAQEKYCGMDDNPNDVRFLEREKTDLILSGRSLGDFVVINFIWETWDHNRIQARLFETLGWHSLRVGSFDQALEQFKQATLLNPEGVLSHAGFANIAYYLGDYQKLKEEVSWLKKNYESNPGLISGRAFLQSAAFDYPPEQSIRIALGLLKQYPQNPWIWESLADSFYKIEDENIAKLCAQRALILIPEQMKFARASLLRLKAKIQVRSNQEEAIESLVQAYLLDRDSESFEKTLSENSDLYQMATMQMVLNRLKVAEPDKQELLFSFYEATGTPTSLRLRSYRNRMITLVNMCLQANVKPVLVSYPIPQHQITEVTQSISQITGASWLNLNSQFEMILRTENKNERLLKYGILTNEGNRRIAEIFAKDIISRSNPEGPTR
jgi:tetratricopeptide (TPR) repeat protein